MYISELFTVVGYFHTVDFKNRQETFCAMCIYDVTYSIQTSFYFENGCDVTAYCMLGRVELQALFLVCGKCGGEYNERCGNALGATCIQRWVRCSYKKTYKKGLFFPIVDIHAYLEKGIKNSKILKKGYVFQPSKL